MQNIGSISTFLILWMVIGMVIYYFLVRISSATQDVESRVQEALRNATSSDSSLNNDESGENSLLSTNSSNNIRSREITDDLLKEVKADENSIEELSFSMDNLFTKAGLQNTSKPLFFAAFMALGVFSSVLVLFFGVGPLLAAPMGILFAVAMPLVVLRQLSARRMMKFSDEFLNAVDIAIRGIRAGVPINECIRIISRECQDPVASEFRYVLGLQKLGLTLEQSLRELLRRVPMAEVSFFSIVLSIHAKSGGNLSEALESLAQTIRDRQHLVRRVFSLTAEARSSSYILAALPVFIIVVVSMGSPGYFAPMLNTTTGNVLSLIVILLLVTGMSIMRAMASPKKFL